MFFVVIDLGSILGSNCTRRLFCISRIPRVSPCICLLVFLSLLLIWRRLEPHKCSDIACNSVCLDIHSSSLQPKLRLIQTTKNTAQELHFLLSMKPTDPASSF